MTRAQVDSAVADRGVQIVSDQPGVVSVVSDQPGDQYEQYLFFTSAANGPSLLWRVTLLYDEKATMEMFDAAAQGLRMQMGDPALVPLVDADKPPPPELHQLTRPMPTRSSPWRSSRARASPAIACAWCGRTSDCSCS
jgi:hypothetical protein